MTDEERMARVDAENARRTFDVHRVVVPRPPSRSDIERYLRATVTIPGGSIEAGVQRSLGEPLTLLRAELTRALGDEALALNGDDVTDGSAGRLIDAIEERIAEMWPARAWFVEIWQADEAVCQVYTPYRMPRVR